MEAINSGIVDPWIVVLFLKKLLFGTVAFGFFIGGVYFAYYLINLYRLPRQSKQFKHQRQNLETQNLIRYIITICCLLLISGLFYFGIEMGESSMHMGALYIREKIKDNKLHGKGKINSI